MQNVTIILGVITAISLSGLIITGAIWLHRWRDVIMTNMAETANQNIRTAQRLTETIGQFQKQQRTYEDQLQMLSQANAQLRQGLVNVATRLDHSQAESSRGDHTVH